MLKPVTAQDIPEVQALFTAVWNTTKQYYNITQKDDKEWAQLVAWADDVYKRYEGKGKPLQDFTKNMLLAALDYLEALSKQREGR